MNIRTRVALIAAGLATGALLAWWLAPPVAGPQPSPRLEELRMALGLVRVQAECGPGSGLSPAEGARRLVDRLRTAGLVSGHGSVQPVSRPVVLDRPGAPWQVVVIGDDRAGQLRILGYGDDLTTPLLRETVDCR